MRIHPARVLAFVIIGATAALAEDVTVTTYYPSPRGVYDQVRARGVVVRNDTIANNHVVITGLAPSVKFENPPGTAKGHLGLVTVDNAHFIVQPATDVDDLVLTTNSAGGELLFGTSTACGGTPCERMRIEAGGDVGIGTTDPSKRLEVRGGSFLVSSNVTAWGGTLLSLGDDNYGLETVDGGGADDDLRVKFFDAGPRSLHVWGTNSNSSLLTVQSDGEVAIGESFTSPTAQLHLLQEDTADAFRVDDASGDPTPFVITADGDVAIGDETSSGTKLFVRVAPSGGSTVNQQALKLYDAAGFSGRHMIFVPRLGDEGFNNLSDSGDQGFFFSASFAAPGSGTGNLVIGPWQTGGIAAGMRGMRITSSGAVGINVKNPTATLDIRAPGIDGLRVETATGVGIRGIGNIFGVVGENPSSGSQGILGSDADIGVDGSGAIGVKGTGGTWAGQFIGSVYVADNLTVGGSGSFGVKPFVQPHPLDPTKEISYVAFEGREVRIFFDGVGRLTKGEAVIVVPEDFRQTASADVPLNVILTPFGQGSVYVKERTAHHIRVASLDGRDVEFGYLVIGTRAGFEAARPIQDNTHFRPSATDTVEEFEARFQVTEDDPYYGRLAKQLNQDLLKRNGMLTADGRLNTALVQRLGWTYRDAAVARAAPSPDNTGGP